MLKDSLLGLTSVGLEEADTCGDDVLEEVPDVVVTGGC